jgi:glutaredoxin
MQTQPTQTSSNRVQVFWQPGCTACLRVKEFLTKHSIEFESVNVHGNPAGQAQMAALGVRSVPAVALGGRYTLCQSFDDVVKFLGVDIRLADPLPPAELVTRLDIILDAAARYVLQFPEATLRTTFRDRNRTIGATGFHVFRIIEMALEAAQGIELQFASFDDLPPDAWSGADIAKWGLDVKQRLDAWWAAEKDPSLSYLVPTYYGQHTMHNLLERSTWHAAQHTRQLVLMLESHGIAPDRPLTPGDLQGLPVPENVWG